MDLKQTEAAIEAILFTMGDAVEAEKIAKAIEQDTATTEKIIRNMMDRYQAEERGIQIIELETLSIIAYKQPVTRIEIEKIRGVKSDHAVNKLIEYNLVKELGRLDAPGRPLLFGTTEEFLRHFGVQSLDQLPVINPMKVEDFKTEAEEEVELKLQV